MPIENTDSKFCPSCGRLTSIAELTRRVSRSGGKETVTWRCKTCVSLRQPSTKNS